MDLGLAGKCALVSGGSQGIGRAVAATLLHEGAHHDVPISPSYGALKAATINHMAQLAQRWGPDGIRANTVSPGPILIEGRKWDGLRERRPEIFVRDRDAHPTKRMGTADEVANVVVMLASPAAGWVNGAHVIVDGGYTKRVGF